MASSRIKKRATEKPSRESTDETLALILKLSEDTFNDEEHTRRVLEESLNQEKMRVDRAILEQQNREYEESLALDRAKALKKSEEDALRQDVPVPDAPLTREELREARLRYFNK